MPVGFVFAEEIGSLSAEIGHDSPCPIVSGSTADFVEKLVQQRHFDPLVL